MSRRGLAAKLDQLAEKIVDAVLADPKAPIDQQIDVIKVVGAYHLGNRRVSAKTPDEDGEGNFSFVEAKRRLMRDRPDA